MDAGPDGSGCDVVADPSCIDESSGVFVSPTGDDSHDGSKANPLATIGAALKKNKARVYICQGTYAENVDIKANVDLLGGYACGDWSYAASNAATIQPGSGLALHVDSATSVVRDLKFVGADASKAGDSSIGALAASSTVTLVRDDIEAGKGMSATPPSAQADFTPAQASSGNTGTLNNGGGQQPVTCPNGSGSTTGGAGGPPGGANGVKGQPFATYTVNPPNADGTGGVTGSDCIAGLGRNGSYGPGGAAGAGAAKAGTLDATGWAPSAGGAGGTGKVGEGGGGGASLDSAGGGGGGGAGGCGGTGGAAGPGGGASIALTLVQSTATLTQTKLVAKDAGDGAKGGTGQKAQGGGNAGSFFATSCNGGAGGHGGSGGGGGGGAGGLSVGILWTGTAPTIDGSSTSSADTLATVTTGKAGAAGAGGAGGTAVKTSNPASNAGAAGNPGLAGVAKAVMQAP